MLVRILLCIVSVGVFIACDSSDKKYFSAIDINYLQQIKDSVSEDSLYKRLIFIRNRLESNPTLPDSLRGENNYLLGLHFKRLSATDSAAIYFHHATDYVNDSITSDRQANYFLEAWSAYNRLGLSGDCFTISKKFKSLVNPETQYRTLSWAYYWEESTYLMMGEYENALASNKLRVGVAAKDSSNLIPALIGQSNILIDYLNRTEEGTAILEQLVDRAYTYTASEQRLIYSNYGVAMYYAGKFEEALNYYQKALKKTKIISKVNRANDITNSYNNIAEVLIDLKKYDLARKYLDSTRMLGIKNLSRRKQKSLLNYEMRLALENSRSSKRVKQINEEIYQYQDEIYKLQSKNELLELSKSNERQQLLLQEKQITELENLRLQTRSIILVVTLLLLSLIGLLFYRQRKLRFEKQQLQLQQRLFRSQMNPHFTYNTLYAIQNEIKKDQKSAEKYLVTFSRLLRLVLENSMANYIQLEKELETVRKYLELQLLRAPSSFCYEIILENFEEDELVFIPPSLLQPVIENSIEHGFARIDYKGILIVRLKLQGKFLHCSIEDNGIGMNRKVGKHKKSASTQLISDFLKRSTKKSFEIINKQDLSPKDKGVIVRFLIPYKSTEND